MKKIITLSIGLVAFWGCEGSSTGSGNGGNDVTELEGTWVGTELGGGQANWTFVIVDDTVDVTTSIPEEWYIGTISANSQTDPKQADFTITDCPLVDYIGLKSLGIYKIEGNTWTLASNEPGLTVRPTNFIPGDQNNDGHFTRVIISEKQ